MGNLRYLSITEDLPKVPQNWISLGVRAWLPSSYGSCFILAVMALNQSTGLTSGLTHLVG
ncbi:hypothetical protein [Coleofasciculus sp.]|uniref:hypothetical protein n=1 Tax=Coleofasciculus sp. TaxID=3100458 RepID=UPI003A1C789B